MASPTRYVIEIKLKGGGGNLSDGASSKKADSARGATGANASGEANKKTKGVIAAASGYALAVATSAASHYINNIELRTGQALYQQRIQNVIGIGKQIGGFGAAVTGGALTGGVAGAVVGAVGYAAVTGFNYMFESRRIEMERRLESIGLEQLSIRAGAGGSRDGKSY